ncbi:aldehyde dehydrogenase family protein [Noviherbaspirillum denitrificans]|uniref:Aldehyde dehydrogenase n=1 Tax=Noviherbaspirillum denitrificans TaxID=1968433 RepID=A0A254T7S9_9BURK|nr:aldehyde dehydrogenase family protein [Noviherbaspirillum denitrificans]OWW18227.1 aldehyde dehydrogenase [Noviherbaspirillum denitrificans]
MPSHRLFIGGDWVHGSTCRVVRNPSDLEDVVGEYDCGDAGHVDLAVRAAAAALPAWSHSTPQQRFDALDAIGSEILARKTELGTLLAREEGKVLAEAIGEVARAGYIFKFFAGEALRMEGMSVPSVRPGVEVVTSREAAGVVGLVTPWNFPIAIPAWKTAPALACGNTVVLKPSELTPGCAWALADIISRAGLPPGVFNLVNGGGDAGAALVGHLLVNAVSFTGSSTVGRKIAMQCAADGKRCQLEMGGKNPLLVMDDADLELSVACAVNGAFFSTGQRCTASSRIIVTPGIYSRFVEVLASRTRTLRVGHALAPGTEIGPAVDERQLEKNRSYAALAEQEGGRVLAAGQLPDSAHRGHYFAPLLVTNDMPAARLNREEVFGPVATVMRAHDFDHALELANDTPFGLSAGICTQSLALASRFRQKAQAGMVMVNAPTAGVDYHVPFGGAKASSMGPREQGRAALEFYTKVKTHYIAP